MEPQKAKNYQIRQYDIKLCQDLVKIFRQTKKESMSNLNLNVLC